MESILAYTLSLHVVLGLFGIGFFISENITVAATAQDIMGGADCLACHQTDQKLVGPSFQEIAKKYTQQENVTDILIQSVKTGSAGKWGPIAMPPHPTLPDAEIKKMIDEYQRRGMSRVKEFSWGKAAVDMVELYDRVTNK